jgi:RND family efflux transporter MFP subunit
MRSLYLVIAVLLLLPFSVFGQETLPGQKLQARGIIIAKHQPVISSELSARVEKVPFREGDYFTKGQLLVSFNKELLSAQRDKAEAELDGALQTLENNKHLERLESIGTLDVSLAEVEVKGRRAEVKMTNIALNRCQIKAPFNGRVVALYIDEHESVAPNQKLLEIVSTEQLLVEVMGPSNWLSWLSPGQLFSVKIDALSIETVAKIISVGAVVDPVSGMIKFQGQLVKDTAGLLPGMMATTLFNAGEKAQ